MMFRELLQEIDAVLQAVLKDYKGSDMTRVICNRARIEAREDVQEIGKRFGESLREGERTVVRGIDAIIESFTLYKGIESPHRSERTLISFDCDSPTHKGGRIVAKASIPPTIFPTKNISRGTLVYSHLTEAFDREGNIKCYQCESSNGIRIRPLAALHILTPQINAEEVGRELMLDVGRQLRKPVREIDEDLTRRIERFGFMNVVDALIATTRYSVDIDDFYRNYNVIVPGDRVWKNLDVLLKDHEEEIRQGKKRPEESLEGMFRSQRSRIRRKNYRAIFDRNVDQSIELWYVAQQMEERIMALSASVADYIPAPALIMLGGVKRSPTEKYLLCKYGPKERRMQDFVRMRAIVPTEGDCYDFMQYLRSPFSPFEIVEGTGEDYIAQPKPNGYRSLHVYIQPKKGCQREIDDERVRIELQIRTNAMDNDAEIDLRQRWDEYKLKAQERIREMIKRGDIEHLERELYILKLMLEGRHTQYSSGYTNQKESTTTIHAK